MALKAEETRLLAHEQKAHLDYVRDNWTLLYPQYEEWYEQIMDYAATDEPGQLVLLIGVTHVGKSALMKFCDSVLTKLAVKAGHAVNGSGYIRIPSASNSKFDRGETYRRLHQAMLPDVPERFVKYGDYRDGAIKRGALPRRSSVPSHAALLQAVVNRMNDGYLTIFLDEIGELPLLLKSGGVMEAGMSIKEIADLSQKTAFMAGGPEVAPMLWQNAQLTARIRPIWMHPLNCGSARDFEQFWGFLTAIAAQLGPDYIASELFSKENALYTMRQTWGAVGLASKNIIRAASSSLRRTGKPLEWALLQKTIDKAHDEMRFEMPLELKLFAAAQDPERREDYWAAAANLRMRETFGKRAKPSANGTGSAKPKGAEASAKSATDKATVGRKGAARPDTPERTPRKNLPEEEDAPA